MRAWQFTEVGKPLTCNCRTGREGLSRPGGVVLREQCVHALQDVDAGLVVELDQCMRENRLGDLPFEGGDASRSPGSATDGCAL